MSGAQWIGRHLFLGRTQIGMIAPGWTPGPNGETWAGLSYLPGARQLLGPYADEENARAMVMKSAQSRTLAMFGAGIETTAAAVIEGRSLRVTARAIWRAGVWRCDRPIDAHAMFAELGRALGFNASEAPKPVDDAADSSCSSHHPPPEPEDMIE